MIRIIFKSHIFVWMAIVTFVWVQEAHAYLDPGMGTMLIQSMVASLVAGFFLIKAYWKNLMNFFSRKKKILSDLKK